MNGHRKPTIQIIPTDVTIGPILLLVQINSVSFSSLADNDHHYFVSIEHSMDFEYRNNLIFHFKELKLKKMAGWYFVFLR